MEWNNVFYNFCSFMFEFHIGMNKCLALKKHLEKLCVSCFNANKDNLLHVTHSNISLLSFGINSCIST
jgi:hypothetical protein